MLQSKQSEIERILCWLSATNSQHTDWPSPCTDLSCRNRDDQAQQKRRSAKLFALRDAEALPWPCAAGTPGALRS